MIPIYAIGIGLAIFFGFKLFTSRRDQMVKRHIGEGFCVHCGGQIINKKCQTCDDSEDKIG